MPPLRHGRRVESRVADGPALWSGQSASNPLKPELPVLKTETFGFGLSSSENQNIRFLNQNFRFCQTGISDFVRVAYPKCCFMYIFSRISFHVVYFIHKHSITLIHASHSCIIVTESSENEPVEPAESVEPEPGVQFAVEPEANRGKQLSMIPCSYLI